MLIKSEKMIKKIFDRVYGIACYGEHFSDTYNMGIPYELDADENISEIINSIYNLRCKIAKDINGQDFDIDDYATLNNLDSLYDRLLYKYCYKMFLYGYILNPENSANGEI